MTNRQKIEKWCNSVGILGLDLNWMSAGYWRISGNYKNCIIVVREDKPKDLIASAQREITAIDKSLNKKKK